MPPEIRFSRLPSSLPNWWLSLPATGLFMHWTKSKAPSAGDINTDYPIVACPAVANGNVYTGSSNGKFYSIRLADGTPNWIADGLNGYIESRPAIDGTNASISEPGEPCSMPSTGEPEKKVWKFDTERGRYFSPGACWPIVLPYRKDGKVIRSRSSYSVPTTLYAPSTPKTENPLGIGRSERTRINRLLPGRKDNVHKRHQEQHYGSRCFKRKLHSALEYTDAV